jgi:hypothetical protein
MPDKVVLKTGVSLGAFLDGVIQETVKSALYQKALQEKEKQAKASAAPTQGGADNSGSTGGDDTDLFGVGDSGGDEGAEGVGDDATTSKTMDDETEKLKQGDVEPKDVIDKLNAIRSGKSFKDDNVSAAMDEYVGSLSKAEKTALLAFLKGIAQIVTGEVPGQQAVEPEDDPAQVSMKKGPEKQKTKHIEPNVIKAAMPKTKAKTGTEDTSGPVPITPKKK